MLIFWQKHGRRMKELKLSFLEKTKAKILAEGIKIPKASCKISIDATEIISKIKNCGLKLDAVFLSAMAEIIYIRMPEINVRWIDDKDEPKLELYETLNFGLAIEAKNGLAVVTIKDVEHKNIWQLNSEIKELAEKAKQNRLDMQYFEPRPNVVFNNVGIYQNIIDGDSLMQPWNTFMVSAFRITETPVVAEGCVVIRPMMNVRIFFHKPIDGKAATKFLNLLKEALEDPRF